MMLMEVISMAHHEGSAVNMKSKELPAKQATLLRVLSQLQMEISSFEAGKMYETTITTPIAHNSNVVVGNENQATLLAAGGMEQEQATKHLAYNYGRVLVGFLCHLVVIV
eukprot:scaffold7014_cov134-Skeletonema_dohrnii-CCMP3373.AAC.4